MPVGGCFNGHFKHSAEVEDSHAAPPTVPLQAVSVYGRQKGFFVIFHVGAVVLPKNTE